MGRRVGHTRTMDSILLLAWVVLCSCSADYGNELAVDSGRDAQDDLEAVLIRMDVLPPDETFGKLLSQTFLVDLSQESAGDIELLLSAPGRVTGQITGYELTPWQGADLPGEEVPVEAEVVFRRLASSQVFYTSSSAQGHYDALVVPAGDYWLSVIPEDPVLPVKTISVVIEGDATLDVELPGGEVLWGEVLDDEGEPMVGARVQVVNYAGVASQVASTDADGRYLLRVVEGDHTVRCLGREGGRDPVLSVPVVAVGEEGRRVSFTYPQLDWVTASGRLVSSQGLPVRDALVQFTASELDGYEEITASLVREAWPSSQGTWDLSVPAGTWRAEVLPEDGVEQTPISLGTIRLELGSNVDLGNLVLPDLVEVEGRVVDPTGTPVPQAVLRASELGFGQRQFTFVSDDSGDFFALLPEVELEFVLSPPGDWASDLSYTRTNVDAREEGEKILRFQRGERVRGIVLDSEERPLPWAVVEVRDNQGDLWALTLTDTEGRFDIGLAWSP